MRVLRDGFLLAWFTSRHITHDTESVDLNKMWFWCLRLASFLLVIMFLFRQSWMTFKSSAGKCNYLFSSWLSLLSVKHLGKWTLRFLMSHNSSMPLLCLNRGIYNQSCLSTCFHPRVAWKIRFVVIVSFCGFSNKTILFGLSSRDLSRTVSNLYSSKEWKHFDINNVLQSRDQLFLLLFDYRNSAKCDA